jgi:hypothetical protein
MRWWAGDGGQAMGMAMRPKLMLFAEPTSALDPQLVGEVLASRCVPSRRRLVALNASSRSSSKLVNG